MAVNAAEAAVLETYRRRAEENRVPVEWLTEKGVCRREPRVRAQAALLLPTSGIVDPTALVARLHHLACGCGTQFFAETRWNTATAPETLT